LYILVIGTDKKIIGPREFRGKERNSKYLIKPGMDSSLKRPIGDKNAWIIRKYTPSQ
jgi:hypothetical protein